MRFERLFTTVTVAALVALASFTGAVGAVESSAGTETNDQVQADESVQLNSMEVENLSTSMEVQSATITVQRGDQTETVQVDSASIELTDATVQVDNATLEGDVVSLDEATVMVTDGTIEIESSQGDRTIDLSGTNTTVENQRVVLSDLASETLGISGDLGGAVIREMTVAGVSGEADLDSMAVNLGPTEVTGDDNVSVGVLNGSVAVENGSVTLMNATLEDGTIQAEQVNASAASVSVEAEQLIVLKGLTLVERENVSENVEDVSFTRTDVEVETDELSTLFDQLLGAGAAATA